MNAETVTFSPNELEHLVEEGTITIDGHSITTDEDYSTYHHTYITDGEIERLRNGEVVKWSDVWFKVGSDYEFAPSPSNPDMYVCEDGGMVECASINIDNMPDPEDWFSFDSVLGRCNNEEDDDSPQAVLSELQDTFEEKNADYGNSWEKIGVIKRVIADDDGPRIVTTDDGEEAVVLADTPRNQSTFQENADGVITRLLDKIIRAYNLILMADEPQVENESSADAAEDASGYSAMLASLIRRQA